MPASLQESGPRSLPEVFTKPTRDGIDDCADDEVATLAALLARIDLRPVDEAIASLAVAL
ncbi:MAG: hypothetical protein ACYCV7_17085 [Acidimicrobiales bacterium]